MDSVYFSFSKENLYGVPNAFTPGSGVNNEFKLQARGIAQLNYFRIYNRWGNLLFETKDLNIGWDGSFNGAPQPMGVYIYEIQAVSSVTGKLFNKRGNVTLLR
jgi:gliding motility-associated-like protein